LIHFYKRYTIPSSMATNDKRKTMDDLKDRVKCPVCLEVPRVGPIFACPNGHHVCAKCKRGTCPVCREVMGNNQSLLALDVIENILHKCQFVKCDDRFPLGAELAGHEKNCKHREVSCPKANCDKKFPLSDLSEHFGKLTCSYEPFVLVNKETGIATIRGELAPRLKLKNINSCGKIAWFSYTGIDVAHCVEKVGDYHHFFTVMLQSEEVCSRYAVEWGLEDAAGVSNLKFRGNPISIDTAKLDMKHFGLIVHHKVLEKMISMGFDKLTVSFSLK